VMVLMNERKRMMNENVYDDDDYVDHEPLIS